MYGEKLYLFMGINKPVCILVSNFIQNDGKGVLNKPLKQDAIIKIA